MNRIDLGDVTILVAPLGTEPPTEEEINAAVAADTFADFCNTMQKFSEETGVGMEEALHRFRQVVSNRAAYDRIGGIEDEEFETMLRVFEISARRFRDEIVGKAREIVAFADKDADFVPPSEAVEVETAAVVPSDEMPDPGTIKMLDEILDEEVSEEQDRIGYI